MSHAMQITPNPMAIRAVYCTASVHIHRPLRCVYRGEIAVTDTCFIPHFCGATAFGFGYVLPSSVSGVSLDQNGSGIVRLLKRKCRSRVGALGKTVIKLIMRSFLRFAKPHYVNSPRQNRNPDVSLSDANGIK